MHSVNIRYEISAHLDIIRIEVHTFGIAGCRLPDCDVRTAACLRIDVDMPASQKLGPVVLSSVLYFPCRTMYDSVCLKELGGQPQLCSRVLAYSRAGDVVICAIMAYFDVHTEHLRGLQFKHYFSFLLSCIRALWMSRTLTHVILFSLIQELSARFLRQRIEVTLLTIPTSHIELPQIHQQ